MLGAGQAFCLEKLQRIPDGHSGHAIVVYQLRLGWKPVPFAQSSGLYRRT